MERGTAVHALLFGTREVIGYAGVRRGKNWDAFEAEHARCEILPMKEYDRAQRMAEAVRASGLAMEVLAGDVEKTLLFRWMGMQCRATPDVRGANYLTELKTSAYGSPERFRWHALRMGYHAQMRMQCLPCGQMMDCNVVVVESSEPHVVTVFRWTQRAMEVGYKLITLWMERLRTCEHSQQWPGYAQSIVDLDVPEELALEYGDDDAGDFPDVTVEEGSPFEEVTA